MQKYHCLFIIWVLCACNTETHTMNAKYKWPENIKPPIAARINKELAAHDDKRTDEYYWLNERSNPDVIKHLEAENRYTDSMMAGLKPLQEKLFTEMKSRIQEKDESLPYFVNGYWYYHRYEEGYQYPVTARKKQNLAAPEEVLLEQNQMATGLSYFRVGG